jgi:hypothetical protein
MRNVLWTGVACILASATALALASEPQGVTDPQEALREAIDSYRDDEFEDALLWIDRAAELIVAEMDDVDVFARSNAATLLEYLGYYHDYAYGKHPDLDAEYEDLVFLLEKVLAVDQREERISQLGDDSVHYSGIEGPVSHIGDLSIHYSGTSNLISYLGKYSIHYSGTSNQPSHIGSITIHCSGIDGRVISVAGESVH